MSVDNFFLDNLIGKEVQLEPLAEHHYQPLRHAANDERIWSNAGWFHLICMPNPTNEMI